MERQASVCENSKKIIGSVSSSFAASRRGESSVSLATDDRKRTTIATPIFEAGEASAGLVTLDDSNNHTGFISGAKFDKLEALGPSLLEVLTLVQPPMPQASRRQQEAGEDAAGDNNASLDELAELTEINSAAKFDVCLTRSAIVGKLINPSADNTRKLQEFFAKTLEKIKCEATGVVLLQDTTVLLFFETTADEFLELCKHLKTQDSVLDTLSLKVLGSCDGNPVRILQGLYFRKITITRTAADAGEWTDDSLRQVTVDTFINLVKFMKRIGPMPPAEIRKALTTLSNSDQMLLPSNDLVLWLIGREDIMDAGEFLTLFASPIAIELESERVWPVHPLLSY